jgi:hypothetical protein
MMILKMIKFSGREDILPDREGGIVMKKALFILVLLALVAINCCASDSVTDVYHGALNELLCNEAEDILLGNISRLNDGYLIDLISLGKLHKESLRLLRNAIYAKHGHIFESEELTGYFSRFDWYKPAKTVTYADLSEAERENIEVIQKFERMDENSETITWGPEKEGVWQDMFVMAAGWSDRFVIYADNRMEYLFSQMSQLQLIKGLAGTYTIRGNVLLFSVSQVDIYEHDGRFGGSGGYGLIWVNPKENTVYFKNPVILRFPVSKIYPYNKYGIEGLAMEIGGRELYKMEDDVTRKN